MALSAASWKFSWETLPIKRQRLSMALLYRDADTLHRFHFRGRRDTLLARKSLRDAQDDAPATMTALTEFLRFPGLAERERRADNGLDLARVDKLRECCQEFARHLGREALRMHPGFARFRLVWPTGNTDQRAASFECG